jgi:hypothetical protein
MSSICRRSSLVVYHQRFGGALISRHFASINYRHLESITNYMLDSRKNPSGTMDADQIQNSLMAVSTWCTDRNGLVTADRLVNRLGAEFSSGSFVAQKFTDDLVDSHFQVILSTCELSPRDPPSLERAEGLLRRIVTWRQRGIIPDIPIDGIDALVRAWIALDEDAKAAELLFWWTDMFSANEQELAPLFLQMLQHSFDAKSDMAAPLIRQMQKLKNESGWKGHAIDTTNLSSVSTESTTGTEAEATAEDEARVVEISMLVRKVTDFLQDAAEEDLERVQQYQKKLLQLTDFSITEELCLSILDYYIRVKDSKEATAWLQRLDQFGSKLSIFDKVLDVLKVLADGKPEGAPWRVAEIFQRMEQLEEEGAGAVTAEMRHLYCVVWAQSGEPVAEKKIDEIVQRIVSTASEKGTKEPLNKDTYELAFNVLVKSVKGSRSALALLASQWEHLEISTLEDHIRLLMGQLAVSGMSKEANMLMKLASKGNLTVSDDTLVDYVESHAASPDPKSVFRALDIVEQLRGEHVPFECHSRRIRALFGAQGRGAIQEQRALVASVLSGVCNGSITAPAEQVRDLIEYLTNVMVKQGLPEEAENVVKQVEQGESDADRSNLDYLSTRSFNNIMAGWMERGAPKKLGWQFARLKKYHDAGILHLKPDRVSYALFLQVLTKRDQYAAKAEEVLQELLSAYGKSGTEDLKPDEGHFHSVLIALKGELPTDVCDRSMALLVQMKNMGLLSKPFSFNIAMQSILASKDEDIFRRVLDVQALMKEAGIEPNEITHSSLLKACSLSIPASKENALEVAIACIGHARTHTIVDTHVYTGLIKAFRHLLRNDRRNNELVFAAMKACRKDGLLTKPLEQHFRSLLQDGRRFDRAGRSRSA